MNNPVGRRILGFTLGVLIALSANAGSLDGRLTGAGANAPAVVWIEGLSGTPVPQRDAVITHTTGGAFEPAISVGFVGNEYVLRNEDDKLHNTHLYLQLAQQKEVSSRPLKDGATLYNIALPLPGMEVRRPIRPYHAFSSDTGYIAVRCNPHPGEEAAMLVFSHPYAAVAGKDGSFEIADVPAGRHDVWIFRNGAATKWASVDVAATGATELVIDLAKAAGAGR